MKKTLKRAIIAMLSCVMVFTMLPAVSFAAESYGVWLGETEVTSENAGNILGDGTASYDPDSKTLTLNNPTIDPAGSHSGVIYANHELTITGSVTIETGNPIIYTSGDLTLEGGIITATAEAGHAIVSSGGSVTIANDCTVIATTKGTSYDSYDFRGDGIHADGDITIYGNITADATDNGVYSSHGTITIEGTADVQAHDYGLSASNVIINTEGTVKVTSKTNDSQDSEDAIRVDGKLTVENGTVTAVSANASAIHAEQLSISGGDVTATSTDEEAIYVSTYEDDGECVISGGSVTATSDNKEGIQADNLTISGGTVTATSSDDDGIEADSLTISGGTVEATAKGSGFAGLNAGTLTIGNGITKVTANGTDSAVAVKSTSSASKGSNVSITTPEGGKLTQLTDYYTVTPSDSETPVETAVFEPATTYTVVVEMIHAGDTAENTAKVNEAGNKIDVASSLWVPTVEDVFAEQAYFAGDHTQEVERCEGSFQAGKPYYSVAIVKPNAGETVALEENEYIKQVGTPMVNETTGEVVIAFSVTIPAITVTVEFGSNHAAYAQKVADASEEVEMTVSGSTLKYKAEKGSDPWNSVLAPLRHALGEMSSLEDGQERLASDREYNLQPIGNYQSYAAWKADYDKLTDAESQEDDLTLYIQWLKPTGATLKITAPECGTEVSFDEETYGYVPQPEITIIDGNVENGEVTGGWLAGPDSFEPFIGKMEGGKTYTAIAVIRANVGYYINPQKINVEGGNLTKADMETIQGAVFIDVKVEHDFGDWEVTKEATVDEEGEMQRVCKANPEHVDTKVIPKIQQFTITYDLNGGTLDGKTGTVTLKVKDGDTITLPAPTREGYTFDYWKGSSYKAGDKYTVTGDHTFTAQWIKNDAAKTGDEANPLLWLVLLIVAAALATTAFALKTRKEK